MSLAETLLVDMQVAMKAGEAERLGTIRLLRSALANEQIKAGHELSDDETLKVLAAQAKQRRDSIEQYQAAGRNDLVAHEEAELVTIEAYLPPALSEEELGKLVDETVAVAGDNPQMGQVIGVVLAKAGARADGGTVARLVRERLAA